VRRAQRFAGAAAAVLLLPGLWPARGAGAPPASAPPAHGTAPPASPAPAHGSAAPAASAAPPGAPSAAGPAPQAPALPALPSGGIEQLLHDLAEQGEHLATREREVAERERSIGEFEAQVLERIAELESLREEMERRIAAFEAQQGDKLARLAKVYAAMPPQRVAPLLQELEVELAVSILGRMKEKSSAAILAELPKSQAALFTKRIARPLAGPARGGR